MKKIFRDIVVIALLFVAVLAVPLLSEEFSSSGPAAPVTKVAPTVPEVTATKTPPMPEPANEVIAPPEDDAESVAPLEPPPQEPASCSLTGLRTYMQSTSAILASRGDSFVFGGVDEDQDAVKVSIDGGGGIDRVELHGAGYLSLDGVKLRNTEVFVVRNGVPNEVRITPAGLATLSSGHAVIDGDSSDKAVLPSCLSWAEPVPVTVGDVNYMRYDARDSDGLKASVSVSSEMRVVKP